MMAEIRVCVTTVITLALSLALVCAERFESVPCTSPCQTDLDCSLNGICQSGACVCDAAWAGACCEQLSLLPVPAASSYRASNVSTWGGNIISVDGQTFHMWIAEMAPDPVRGGSCGLTTWGDNSQITHVVASQPIGPYVRKEIAVPIWSHNPIVRIDPHDNTLVMWHIGDGNGGAPGKGYCGRNATSPCGEQSFDKCTGPQPSLCAAVVPGWTCHMDVCSGDGANGDCGPDLAEPTLACNNTPADCARAAAAACAATAGCQSFGMSGNWQGLNKAKLFSADSAGLTINPDWCVWVKNSGSDQVSEPLSDLVSSGRSHAARWAARYTATAAETFGCTLHLHTAASPEGPWTAYTQAKIEPCGGNNPAPFYHPNGSLFVVFTDQNMGLWRADTWRGPYKLVTSGACGGGEDPSLYFDKRGNFHCLYHRSPFSLPDIAIGHAYSRDGVVWYAAAAAAANSTIVYEGLGPVVHGKRERPHLYFNDKGDISHLVTGVCITPQCDPLDPRWTGAAEDCSSAAQYAHCDANSPGPGWYDRTYTLVQAVQTT